MAEPIKPKPQKVTPPPIPKDTGPKKGGKKFEGTPDPDKPEPKKTTPKGNTRKPRGRPSSLENKLEELFTGIGVMVGVVNMDDGLVITEHASELAHAYNKLAQENKYVKSVLERLLETSAWSEAVFITAAVLLPIAKNHGWLPETIPNLPT